MWTQIEKYDCIETNGPETVRLDNCALVRKVIKTQLDKITIEPNVPKAINLAKFQIGDRV